MISKNMKIRNGFVSNSSSASFMVPKSSLNYAQGQMLLEFGASDDNEDGWNVYEDKDCIRGFTIMDNEALDRWADKVGFPVSLLEWESF